MLAMLRVLHCVACSERKIPFMTGQLLDLLLRNGAAKHNISFLTLLRNAMHFSCSVLTQNVHHLIWYILWHSLLWHSLLHEFDTLGKPSTSRDRSHYAAHFRWWLGWTITQFFSKMHNTPIFEHEGVFLFHKLWKEPNTHLLASKGALIVMMC